MLFLTFTCPSWRARLPSFLFRLSGLPASPYYETTGIRHFLLSVSFFPPWFRLVRPPPSPNYKSTGIKHVLSSFLFFSWFRLVRLPTSRDFSNYKSTGIRNEFRLHSCFSISFVWLGYRPRLILVITSWLESEPRCLHSCSCFGFVWSAGLTVYESTGIKYIQYWNASVDNDRFFSPFSVY